METDACSSKIPSTNPAQTSRNVIPYVEVINPDGVPGTGDERYCTVPSGGT